PGDNITDEWAIAAFENQMYLLRVYGPNGFYREFKGNAQDPEILWRSEYERGRTPNKPTGNLVLHFENLHEEKEYTVLINDNAYKTTAIQKKIKPKVSTSLVLNLEKSFGWYDFTIRITDFETFEQRFAGHVETG